MTIYYRDDIGVIAVTVNEYGIIFNHDAETILFEDGNGIAYTVPIPAVIEIVSNK